MISSVEVQRQRLKRAPAGYWNKFVAKVFLWLPITVLTWEYPHFSLNEHEWQKAMEK